MTSLELKCFSYESVNLHLDSVLNRNVIAKNSLDLIITSPPYNVGVEYNSNDDLGADITHIAKKIGFKYHSTIIWNEGNISRRTAWGSWLSASAPFVIAPVELILVLYKDEWKRQDKGISTIKKDEFMAWTNGLWQFNGESKKRIGYPAPFPRELPRRCIKLFSYKNDVICDLFSGSGTTMIEAYNNQRKFVGIKLDKQYFELSKQRFFKERSLF